MSPTAPESNVTRSEVPDKVRRAREVTITVGQPENGRISVTILAVPTADLDASGGVFLDLRLGKKDPANMPVVFDGTLRRRNSHAAGDEALAELARMELSAAALALVAQVGPELEVEVESEKETQESATEAPAEVIAPVPKSRRSTDGKYPIMSRQVGPPIQLTVGQSESFRAELAVPAAPGEGEHWYVRARFASDEDQDLRSAWIPL